MCDILFSFWQQKFEGTLNISGRFLSIPMIWNNLNSIINYQNVKIL